jgi:hypothetical protein
MSRQAINDWLSIFLKIALIIAIAAGITWFSVSIYANAKENDIISDIPKYPKIEKAQYEVVFKATNNILLTNEYEHPQDNIYIINGYWEIKDGKYRYNDAILPLDETYFGNIDVRRRTQ